MTLELHPRGNRLNVADAGKVVGYVRVGRSRFSIFVDNAFINAFTDLEAATLALERALNPSPLDPESADGTVVELGTADEIVDVPRDHWSLDASGFVLRNGLNLNIGLARRLVYKTNKLYHLATDGLWYRWDDALPWTLHGAADPRGIADAAVGTRIQGAETFYFGGVEYGIHPTQPSSLANGALWNGDGGWTDMMLLATVDAVTTLVQRHPEDSDEKFFTPGATLGSWIDLGTEDPFIPNSADCTTVPDDAASLVWRGYTWTLGGTGGTQILRDAVVYKDGSAASKLQLSGDELYHKESTTGEWQLRNRGANVWVSTGTTTAPCVTPPPPPPPPPDAGIQTTGSITGGTNLLQVADDSLWSDAEVAAGIAYAITEIGTEPVYNGRAAMERGTRGCGGNWPTRLYATYGALSAGLPNPTSEADNRRFGVDESTGIVYGKRWWNGAVDSTIYPFDSFQIATGRNYYRAMMIPLSLISRITFINRTTHVLTLEKNAVITATNANVYKDFIPIFQADIDSKGVGGTTNLKTVAGGKTVVYGAGIFRAFEKVNYTVEADGNFEIRTPKGCPQVCLDAHFCTNFTRRGFNIRGNLGDKGFGENVIIDGTRVVSRDTPTTDNQWKAPSQFQFAYDAYNCTGMLQEDTLDTDVFCRTIGASNSSNAISRNCKIRITQPIRDYEQWLAQNEACTDSLIEDCEIDSDYIVAGFETFISKRSHMYRIKGRNATAALNGNRFDWHATTRPYVTSGFGNSACNVGLDPTLTSGQPGYGIGAELRFSPGAEQIFWGMFYESTFLGQFAIVVHAGSQLLQDGQVALRKISIINDGYVNTRNEVMPAIEVKTGVPYVLLRDITYQGLTYLASGSGGTNRRGGAQLLNNGSPRLRMRGNVCHGTRKLGSEQYAAYYSTGANSVNEGNNIPAGAEIVLYNFNTDSWCTPMPWTAQELAA